MRKLIERLHREKTLSSDEFRILLDECDDDSLELINSIARSETQKVFGNRIFVRGLIEVGNCCHNDCLYCGIRRKYPDTAITLSLGEKSYEAYKMFYEAGANRYLLRHETHNPYHYSLLHPETMSLQNRLQCLTNLKEIGYQTGTGIMVGSPGQTTDNIIEDILFIGKFKPQMIGIGPFIPHRDTPFADKSAGSIRTTLLLLSIFRLMHPHALIPSTTALASLAPDGRERGILAGANVVMPNLSPPQERSKYSLYNNKASMGAEAAEGLAFLEQKLSAIGYTIDYGRGDYVE